MMKEQSKNKKRSTDDESVGKSEEEANSEGEDEIVSEGITFVRSHGHEGDGKEEVKSGEENKKKRLGVEYVLDVSSILADSVSDSVYEIEDDDFPGLVDVGERFGEGGARVEGEGDHEVEHDEEGIRCNCYTGLVQCSKVALSLNSFFLVNIVFILRLRLGAT